MKLYLYRSDVRIQPFDDEVADAQVMLETLAETQERACRKAGLQLQRVDSPDQAIERPCLLAPDDLYFSEKALADFLKACRKQGSATGARMALARCASVEQMLPLQEIELVDWQGDSGQALYDLWYVPDGDLPEDKEQLRVTLATRCRPLTVAMREIVFPVRMPVIDEQQNTFLFPITSTICCRIGHWTHLLWLSQMAFGVAWMEHARSHSVWAALKLLGSVAKERSINRWKVLGQMNVIGKDCDIHPTAYLEASIIGDGVRIGAGACVRNSLVGDSVTLADHAVVLNAVVGRDCLLTENMFLVSSLCYPGSILGNIKTQMAVIGREVYLHGWCSLLDAKFVGDIKVLHKGKRVGTGRSFIASCVGHRAVLSAKILIHPGREIPNDMVLVSRPEDVIAEIPEDLAPMTPMVRHQGTLVPLETLRKQSRKRS
ncbi:MAG: hypothetical protein JRF33_21740 [Deltaproteobacteria bacterium]|nr:hypothetical protein [Deltaproteobacteria bacterium]